MFKNFKIKFREYILIILTATIFSLTIISESLSEENIFVIEDVKVTGIIDINFSREKYIDKAFISSFKILMPKVLLSKDLNKLKDIKLKKIKYLISSFKILEETYRNDEYSAIYKISYNENKVKKFLGEKNISFSHPENITAVFFPVFFIDDEIQNFNENFFYQQWNQVEIENELINFILPLEDLDDILKIEQMKNKLEELNADDFVNKYDTKDYVFALFDYQNQKLNVYLKTNFNNNKMSKNIIFKLSSLENLEELNIILKDLKLQITDLWKEQNVINLSIPLSIRIKFNQNNLIDLDKLKSVFNEINIIDNYYLDEFNLKSSYFKIYYYGNPKKLKTELIKSGYQLKEDQGQWELYLNE